MNLTSKHSSQYFTRTVLAGLAGLGLLMPAGGALAGERLSLNANWKFTHDDPTNSASLKYADIKDWVNATGMEFTRDAAPMTKPEGNPGGGEVPYAEAGFDDSGWRSLNLPHDWGVEGPFKQEYPGETGKLPWWGVAWYRKHLDVAASDAGKKIYLDVDGAMSYSTVWVNGKFAGGWPYGYASWRVDLTPFLKFGSENVVAIRLDNPPNSSRWYPGGGIYRNVWLVKTEPVHVGHWGTYVTIPNVNPTAATVKMQVRVDNDTSEEATVSVKNEFFEIGADEHVGKAITSVTTDGVKIPAHASQVTTNQMLLNHPKLWSLEKPQRYLMVTTVEQNGKALDRYETPFGIRTIEFTASNGFLLNGKRVPLNGVCDHADLGALGSAVYTRGLERQIEILKDMGCNAIRTSHNPPAPELLDLCDRLGMLVMDESFDCWKRGKTPNDYHLLFSDWHEKDWRAELRRDRNHPSIILWSIGNEIPEQTRPEGLQFSAELTRIAHEEDSTRPTTAACNNIQSGYNGQIEFYNDSYEAMRIAHGNVGIGVTNPTAPLQVNGNIQLGSGGTNYAASSPESLRIVRGLLDPNGKILIGTGFSVHSNSVGDWTISFTNSFSSGPVITSSSIGAQTLLAGQFFTSPTNDYFELQTRNTSGTLVNAYMEFIAIGSP